MVGTCIIFVGFNCLNLLTAACIMLSKRRRVLRRRNNENLSYLLDPPQPRAAAVSHVNIQESHENIEESQNLLWFKELKATRAMRELACTVCLENFIPGEKFIELPCLHPFHPKCIMRWYMVDHSCPMCRRRLD
ncbi:unnamed protein product [Blepharisma stoltei]|uniref:RING-type E3 ubiquitin transferase n=1 Tax=Blepharisma stoltei TaxID=1481888 RepID=A0AAU9J091_9CILI|nr:unnamed protein product [Blepharisma stoltei]